MEWNTLRKAPTTNSVKQSPSVLLPCYQEVDGEAQGDDSQ